MFQLVHVSDYFQKKKNIYTTSPPPQINIWPSQANQGEGNMATVPCFAFMYSALKTS